VAIENNGGLGVMRNSRFTGDNKPLPMHRDWRAH